MTHCTRETGQQHHFLSLQVEEASAILRNQLVKVTELVRDMYSDRVVVMTATVEEAKQLARRTRSILQASEVGRGGGRT